MRLGPGKNFDVGISSAKGRSSYGRPTVLILLFEICDSNLQKNRSTYDKYGKFTCIHKFAQHTKHYCFKYLYINLHSILNITAYLYINLHSIPNITTYFLLFRI